MYTHINKISSKLYRETSTYNIKIDPKTLSFFNNYRELFKKYPSLWLKGGAARSPFLSYIRSQINKNVEYQSESPRDFDLVYIGSYNKGVDEELSSTGEDYEFASSISSYMNTRDFTANEVLLRPDKLLYSTKALRSVLDNFLNLSREEQHKLFERFERSEDSLYYSQDNKLILKNLLLSLREGFDLDSDFFRDDIPNVSYFWLLVFLFKAFESNIEDKFFKALKEYGAEDTQDFVNAEDYLFHLLGNVYNFKITSSQKAIIDRIKEQRLYNKYEDMAGEYVNYSPSRYRREHALKYAAHRVLLSFTKKNLEDTAKNYQPHETLTFQEGRHQSSQFIINVDDTKYNLKVEANVSRDNIFEIEFNTYEVFQDETYSLHYKEKDRALVTIKKNFDAIYKQLKDLKQDSNNIFRSISNKIFKVKHSSDLNISEDEESILFSPVSSLRYTIGKFLSFLDNKSYSKIYEFIADMYTDSNNYTSYNYIPRDILQEVSKARDLIENRGFDTYPFGRDLESALDLWGKYTSLMRTTFGGNSYPVINNIKASYKILSTVIVACFKMLKTYLGENTARNILGIGFEALEEFEADKRRENIYDGLIKRFAGQYVKVPLRRKSGGKYVFDRPINFSDIAF